MGTGELIPNYMDSGFEEIYEESQGPVLNRKGVFLFFGPDLEHLHHAEISVSEYVTMREDLAQVVRMQISAKRHCAVSRCVDTSTSAGGAWYKDSIAPFWFPQWLAIDVG